MNTIITLSALIMVITITVTYVSAQSFDYTDFIPWSNNDSVCSDFVSGGYRECVAVVNITNPMLFDMNNVTLRINTDKEAYVDRYQIFDPHMEDRYSDCPGVLNKNTCSWPNSTVIWEQEQIKVDYREYQFTDLTSSLSKAFELSSFAKGENMQIKFIGKKLVGSNVKWTFCINDVYCLDPLWSDPAGDAQGWYDMPGEFHTQPYSAGDTDDNMWSNWSNANPAGDYCAKIKAGNPCTEAQGTTHAYFWRGGFSQGTYSLGYTGLAQSNYAYENITVRTIANGGAFTNYSLSWKNSFSWNSNTTTDTYDSDGVGVPVYVNSSGVLGFDIWAHTPNAQCSVGYYVCIGAVNITNFTADAGGGNSDPILEAKGTSPASIYASTDIELNMTCSDDDAGDTITAYWWTWLNYTLNQGEGALVVTNNTDTLAYLYDSGNYTDNDNITFEVWCGDGTANTTHENTTTITVLPANSVPTLGSLVEPTDPQTYTYGDSYNFNVTACDADGSGDIDTMYFEFNGVNATVSTSDAVNASCDEYTYNVGSIGAGNYTYYWHVNDTSASLSTLEDNYNVTVNNSAAIDDFYLNETYIDINGSVRVSVVASPGAQVNLTLQTPTDTSNYSMTYNGSAYTLDLSKSELGDESSNASASLNVSQFWLNSQNYTMTTNSSTLSFAYATTSMTGVTVTPKDTYNSASDTVAFSSNYTANGEVLPGNCSVTVDGSLYQMSLSSGLQSVTVSVSGWNPSEYSYTLECINNSYQTQSNNTAESFIVRSGESGGNGNSNGNNNDGGIPPPPNNNHDPIPNGDGNQKGLRYELGIIAVVLIIGIAVMAISGKKKLKKMYKRRED